MTKNTKINWKNYDNFKAYIKGGWPWRKASDWDRLPEISDDLLLIEDANDEYPYCAKKDAFKRIENNLSRIERIDGWNVNSFVTTLKDN